MSTKISNPNEAINTVNAIETGNSDGPWIPQTPDSQQEPDPRAQWQDEEE